MMDGRLKETIADELNVDPAELNADTVLTSLELWDSVMVLSIMVILSESLGQEILPGEMVRLKTFGDLEWLVASKRS